MTGSARFRFDHVGLLTPNTAHALATYRAIGVEVFEQSFRAGQHDIAYAGVGTDVLLEIQTAPLSSQSQEYLDRQGWSIERIALRCDDVDAAYAELTKAGVRSAWEPREARLDDANVWRAAGVWSPDGLMVEIVQHDEVVVPRPTRASRDDLALHHACCLTPDLAAAEAFWSTNFGLSKTYDFTAPLEGGTTKGFVMLSDPDFDESGHEFSLEIIGGEFDTIDGPVFERRGACFDHLCFTTDDVEGTWRRAVEQGVEPLSEPAYYAEYDSTIAWLYDADGTHVELMSPVPAGLMAEAHRSGVCSNHWDDDWQRGPVVLPRRGDQPVEVNR